jgi:hypothetical protein
MSEDAHGPAFDEAHGLKKNKTIFKKLPLYIDIDGVLFMFGQPEAYGGREGKAWNLNLRPYATAFLYWCHSRFDCRWLSAWKEKCPKFAANIYARFAYDWPVIPWNDNKTEGINFNEDFIWIDDDDFNSEQQDLETFRNKYKFQRFILVDKYNINELVVVKDKLQTMLEESGYAENLVG